MDDIAKKGFFSDSPKDAQAYSFEVNASSDEDLGWVLSAEFTLHGQTQAATLDLCTVWSGLDDSSTLEMLDQQAAAAQAFYNAAGEFLMSVLDARTAIYTAQGENAPALPFFS
jgi:hypothetical protein